MENTRNIIEGRRAIAEAMRAGLPIDKLFVLTQRLVLRVCAGGQGD